MPLLYAPPIPRSAQIVQRLAATVACVLLLAATGAIVGGLWDNLAIHYSCGSILYVDLGGGNASAQSRTPSVLAASIRSEPFVRASLAGAGVPTMKNLTATQVLNGLSAAPLANGSVVLFSYEDRDPQRALAVSKALVAQAGRVYPNISVLENPTRPARLRQRSLPFFGLVIGGAFGLVLPWTWRRFRRAN